MALSAAQLLEHHIEAQWLKLTSISATVVLTGFSPQNMHFGFVVMVSLPSKSSGALLDVEHPLLALCVE